MVINNRDRQRTRVVFVPVNTGGGSQEKIKVGESGIKFGTSTFTEVPQGFDFSDVTDMEEMFYSCHSLTTVPPMDTSQATNMRWMFYSCASLTTVAPMDTSHVTNMNGMFLNCQQLTTVPPMDTSQVTNMIGMFSSCGSLTTVPPMDTSNVTGMNSMFDWCSALTSVPEMNTSQVTYMGNLFNYCEKLTDMGGFIGLKVDITLSYCPLTHDSLMNVINKAADVTEAPATMTLGADNLAKLSDEEKAIATSKGWTLA